MKGFIIVSVTSVILSVASCLLFFSSKEKKLAYIDNVKLFNEFKLKKELSADLEKSQVAWKTQLDSLKLQLDILARRLNEQEKKDKEMIQKFELTRNDYMYKEQLFSQNRTNIESRYNEQIWKQLNEYIKEFSSEKNFDFVLGTSGDGNLMFAKQDYDVTDQAIVYVNNRYKDKK